MKAKPWTGAEVKTLSIMVNNGLTNQAIADQMGRSYSAVVAQVSRMKLYRPVLAQPVDFTVTIPAALYDKFEAEAKRRGMSKGRFYRLILEQGLGTTDDTR